MVCSVCVYVIFILRSTLVQKKWSFEKIYVVSKSTDQCLS